MGSFVRLDKSGSSSVDKKGDYVFAKGLWSKGNSVFRPERPYDPPIYGLGENK